MVWVVVDEATSDTNSARNQATGSFTPTADALVLFGAGAQEGNVGDALVEPFSVTGEVELNMAIVGAEVGPSDGYGWGSTTQGSGDYIVGGGVYDDQADATPVAENLTVEVGPNFYSYCLGVLGITGHDTTTPIVQSNWATDGYSGGSNGPHNLAVTLGSAPTAGNLLVCFAVAGADSGGGFSLPYAGSTNDYSNGGALAQANYLQSRWFYREVVSGDSATTQINDLGQDVGCAAMFVVEIAAEGGAATEVDPVEAVSLTASDVANIDATANVDPIEAASVTAADTADIVPTTEVDPVESSSITASDAANIVPTSTIDPVETASVTASDIADIDAEANVDPVEAFSVTASDVADVQPQADIDPVEAASVTASDIADVSTSAQIDPVDAASITASDIADVEPTTNVDPVEAASITASDLADVSTATEIDPVEAASITASDVADVQPQADIDPVEAASLTASDIADIQVSSTIDPVETSSLTTSDVADIDPTAEVDPVEAVSLTTSDVADITAALIIDPVGSVSLTVSDGADIIASAQIDPIGTVSLTTSDVAGIVGPGADTWIGTYNYFRAFGTGILVPTTGQATHDQEDRHIIRFHKTDATPTDRSSDLLNLTPGDVIATDGARYWVQEVTEVGTRVDVQVVPPIHLPADGSRQFTFEIYTGVSLAHLRESTHWSGTALTGVVEGLIGSSLFTYTTTDDAVGVDGQIQRGYVSPEWDVVSPSVQ